MVLYHIVCTYVRKGAVSGRIYCRVLETLLSHVVLVHLKPFKSSTSILYNKQQFKTANHVIHFHFTRHFHGFS